MTLLLGDIAPDFSQDTTEGPIHSTTGSTGRGWWGRQDPAPGGMDDAQALSADNEAAGV